MTSYKIAYFEEDGMVILEKFESDVNSAVDFIARTMWDKDIHHMVVTVNTGAELIMARWSKKRLVESYYAVGLDDVRSKLEAMGL